MPRSTSILGSFGWLALTAAVVACGSPDASSSTHWLTCQTDLDCSNVPGSSSCGPEHFCVADDGHRIERVVVFEDDFDAPGIDPTHFAFETGRSIRNGDAEAYTDRAENAFTERGELVLRARAESYDGASYTSASLHTEGLHGFTYGRIAARILVPDGAGTGPAFWMLPEAPGERVDVCDADGVCTNATWPAWGDIVIMTARSERPEAVLHTASYAKWNEAAMQYVRGEGGDTQILPESAAAHYHEYAVEWGPERIDWSTDGVVDASFDTTSADILHPGDVDPFSRAFNVRLSLAVGGLSETPNPALYPQDMRVDWLRVWQYR